MHPVVCLDRGFSSEFETEFGWYSKGSVLTISSAHEVSDGLAHLAAEARAGAWIVLALNYEAGFALMDLPHHLAQRRPSQSYLTAYIYDEPPQALELNDSIGTSLPSWKTPDFDAYERAFQTVQDAITEGVCYQVNQTFRLRGTSKESPWDLYQLLVNNQPADFGGFIDFGHDQVLSRSPELFVEKRGQYLRSEPMKGTARRDPNPIIDQQILDDLLSDAKMQAENLMIVDLIRNDLSRVSESHSVLVSRLFEPRTLSSVHQVFSVIESTLRSDIDTCALIKALFPCGSVVGAPKAKAFELIQMLESDARGIYTGSLGLMEPNGDMTFSVAIRPIEQCGEQVVLGLGSGLVADSDLQDEWAECLLKGQFAGAFDPRH